MAVAEHFVTAPDWRWWILLYFFLAGISGGSYAIATMLRLWGDREDEAAARLAYVIALVALVPCPVFLTVDLGQPLRFWHMMVDTTPGAGALDFKYWSPMSVGVWALLLYGVFAFVSFLEVVALDRRLNWLGWLPRLLSGASGQVFRVLGTAFGLFIGAYTGVLLSVSNQPIWSDSFALGGLFLASGLSGAAATISLLSRFRKEALVTEPRLAQAESYFAALEVLILVVFLVTLAAAGTLGRALAFPWLLLWLVAVAAALWPAAGLAGRGGRVLGQDGTVAVAMPAARTAAMSVAVLIGVLALRMAVIWSAQ